ncbi:MAG TPA: transcription elongation factor subunit Spt4 [archaeon]|nr:transcription elongation factor subunit Spt4 [archaeon]
MKQDKACRSCRFVMEEPGEICPVCGSNAFTTFWRGYVIILNPEKSEIAQKMGITKTGKYALRLSR